MKNKLCNEYVLTSYYLNSNIYVDIISSYHQNRRKACTGDMKVESESSFLPVNLVLIDRPILSLSTKSKIIDQCPGGVHLFI